MVWYFCWKVTMKPRALIFSLVATSAVVFTASPASAESVSQYASSAEATSFYVDGPSIYPAANATGAPDQPYCGDVNPSKSWASLTGNTTDTLTLTFATKVVPTSIKIWNTVDARTLTTVEVSSNGTTWTQVFSRTKSAALTTGATCLLAGDAQNYPPFMGASNGAITPHTLTSINSTFPNSAVDRVRLTYDEALGGSITSLWGGETDAVQLIGNAPAAPTVSGTPSVSGTAKVSKVLTANAGTWAGVPAPTVAYLWYACSSKVTSVKTSVPAGCTAISGATSKTFKLKSAQAGKYIGVKVTATNAVRSVVRFTKTTSTKISS